MKEGEKKKERKKTKNKKREKKKEEKEKKKHTHTKKGKEIKQTPEMVTVPGTANPLSDSYQKKTKTNKQKKSRTWT